MKLIKTLVIKILVYGSEHLCSGKLGEPMKQCKWEISDINYSSLFFSSVN